LTEITTADTMPKGTRPTYMAIGPASDSPKMYSGTRKNIMRR